jgi:HD-GYP domain-containing protein (c-di-GMP phosphodiesterase class II)
LAHHEWWNGKGYPQGLKSTKIPLMARIFAVAEVYDALLSERVYKPAMTEDKAFSELWECAKKGQLEPRLVEVFARMMDAPQFDPKPQSAQPKNLHPHWE